ncbi:hypothetical protein PHPALM_30603 [Phytophthora palmivora]|uniref:GAG-pre-integrase domain-containing protein n=1 Tax=Phytophthora palmivora TaxID=4796 RepID=A0A2P4X4Q3_9STRA|nr:hypothetical protein PHPALM_30603 [Phytophthora palmivora]
MTVLQTSHQAKNTLRLWHLRLTHANGQAIKTMAAEKLAKGLELSKSELNSKSRCYNCKMAKMKRMSFRMNECPIYQNRNGLKLFRGTDYGRTYSVPKFVR